MHCSPTLTPHSFRLAKQAGGLVSLSMALAILPGCLKKSCEDLVETPPALHLGTGEEHFEAFADGASLPAAYGPQGGSHVWASLRTTGLFGGFSGPAHEDSVPSWDIDLQDDVGPIGETTGMGRFPSIGDGQAETVGITVFLWLSMASTPWLYDDPNPPPDTPFEELQAMDQAAADAAMDKDLTLTATVTDACGRSASTARPVRLVGYDIADMGP